MTEPTKGKNPPTRPTKAQQTPKTTQKLHQTTLVSTMRRTTRAGGRKNKGPYAGKTGNPNANDMLAEDQFPPLAASTSAEAEEKQAKGGNSNEMDIRDNNNDTEKEKTMTGKDNKNNDNNNTNEENITTEQEEEEEEVEKGEAGEEQGRSDAYTRKRASEVTRPNREDAQGKDGGSDSEGSPVKKAVKFTEQDFFVTIRLNINAPTKEGRQEQAVKVVDTTLSLMRGRSKTRVALLPLNDPKGTAIQMLNPEHRITPGKKKGPPPILEDYINCLLYTSPSPRDS